MAPLPSISRAPKSFDSTAPNLQVIANNAPVMRDCMSDGSVANIAGLAQEVAVVDIAINNPENVVLNTSRSSKSWSDIVNKADYFISDTLVLSHKPEVAPIFLNFQWVSREGFKTLLIEVPAVVGKVIGDINVDGVQPLCNGWQIYIKMEADRAQLLTSGLQLAGKWISLQAPICDSGFSTNAKIILKDLPMNKVSNQDVLVQVKKICEIKSKVWYSNIWVDGKKTHLRNGDHFFYIAEKYVNLFQKNFMVRDYQACVIKPASYNYCTSCQLVGHQPSSDLCIAKAPMEVQQSIQVFHGQDNPLSNMFICPEGCSWGDDGTIFNSSEQEFQFEKVVDHGKAEEAYELVEMEDIFCIKACACELILTTDISEEWLNKEEEVLHWACFNKFNACSHACEVLLSSKSELVEGTTDLKWGSGLDPCMTAECLPDYWPGKNKMGKMLKEIRSVLLEARHLQELNSDLSCRIHGLNGTLSCLLKTHQSESWKVLSGRNSKLALMSSDHRLLPVTSGAPYAWPCCRTLQNFWVFWVLKRSNFGPTGTRIQKINNHTSSCSSRIKKGALLCSPWLHSWKNRTCRIRNEIQSSTSDTTGIILVTFASQLAPPIDK